MIIAAAGGQRLDILSELAPAPLGVSELAKRLFLSISIVSRELRRLEEHGMVASSRHKTTRFYRLSERVQVHQRDGMLQLSLQVEAGHWMLIHQDQATAGRRAVRPPSFFLDPEELQRHRHPGTPGMFDDRLDVEEQESGIEDLPQGLRAAI